MIKIKPKNLISTFLSFILVGSILAYTVAADPFRDYLHSSVASGGNSNTGGAFQPDLFTGAASYAFPIGVPSGTNGLQPQLSIIYNSHNAKRRNGEIGNGWSLSQSYILRDVDYTPADTSDDKFKLFLNGNMQDLVYSNGRYHTKIESFLYINKVSGGNNQKKEYWILKTKDGTVYRFGYNPDSELVSNQNNYVTRWSLDLVTDTHGNNIFYSYKEDPNANDIGTVYPYKIEYNNDKTREIEFVLESSDRPYQVTTHEQGHKVRYARRLSEIIVKADLNLVSKYALEYGDIGNENSLLSSITVYGNDGTGSLPSTEFSYYHSKGWERNDGYNPPMYFIDRTDVSNDNDNRDWVYHDSGARIADINRDGIPEYIENDYAPEDFVIELEVWGGIILPAADNGLRMGDFNGDGYTDFIIGNSYNDKHKTWLGPKKRWWEHDEAWTLDVSFSGVACFKCEGKGEFYSRDGGRRIADINGDGMDDIISGGVGVGFMEYYDDGDKWGDTGLRLADINGDGLPDLLQSNDDGNIKKVWINDGASWYEDNSWSIPMYFIDNNREDSGVRLADINGDGLTDILTNDAAYVNTGNGWSSDSSWTTPTKFTEVDENDNCKTYDDCKIENEGVKLGDVNGDGAVDVIKSHKFSGKGTWLSQGGKNFLLKEIKNSLGGSTVIDYKESTSLSGNVNFNIWVVSSIIQDNGVEGLHKVSSTINYGRSGGFFDYEDREFRGFSYVTEIRPDNSEIQHWFYQDDAKKGMEYRTEILDSTNNPYKKIENEFSSEQKDEYYIVTLDSTKEYTYDGIAENPKITQADFDYDEYGNILKTSSFGDVSVFGDEKYTYAEYSYDTRKWILSNPKKSYLLDSDDSTKAEETLYAYDDFGNLKKAEFWLDTGINPIVNYDYDSFGNLMSETDSNGQITSYKYDLTNTFVVKDINPKNHETSYEYDLGTGNLLSIIDSNNFETEYKYDIFGRITKGILPYDSANSPTAEYIYDFDGTAPGNVTIKQKENEEGTLDSYYFYDGFGNLIQSKSESEISQLITNDYYYDGLLRLKQESNPYYSADDYTAPDTSIPKTTYEYDALGRIIRGINPDDTETKTNYDHWVTSAYDENNDRKDYVEDSYRNIIAVKEYDDSSIYTTNYKYDTNNNLIKIQDNQGNIITYTYDTLGRKTRLIDPDLGSWSYKYDNAGNLIEQIDAKDNKISMDYDELNRVTRKSTSSSTINFYYDLDTIGTLSRIESPVEITYHDYDNRLRAVKEKKVIDGIEFITEWTYDSMDRVTSKKLPDGTIITYNYNNQGMLESVSEVIASIDYNENNMVVDRTYTNSASTKFEYDAKSYRLLNIKTNNKQDMSYTYDDVGNILAIDDSVNNHQDSMEYDNRNQLVKAKREDNGNKDIYNIDYSYDTIGNLLSLISNLYNLTFNYTAHAPYKIEYSRPELNKSAMRLCPLQQGICEGSMQYYQNSEWSECDYGLDYETEEVSCDTLDNNCNGQIDEGYISSETSCGVGVCSATGFASCADGEVLDSCISGTPSNEISDGLDNNCDGEIDEGWYVDLQPIEITYFSYAEPIKPGMWIYFDTGIKNVGNLDTPETFNVKWFMDGEKVGHGLHAEVKAGETMTKHNSQYVWYSALPGIHTFTFVVDSEDHIAESNEGNNEINVMVTIE